MTYVFIITAPIHFYYSRIPKEKSFMGNMLTSRYSVCLNIEASTTHFTWTNVITFCMSLMPLETLFTKEYYYHSVLNNMATAVT